jgi:hypothetical protein
MRTILYGLLTLLPMAADAAPLNNYCDYLRSHYDGSVASTILISWAACK